MSSDREPVDLLEHLNVGLSVMTFCPDDPSSSRWVYINEARCNMVGKTWDEIFDTPPFHHLSRESRAQIENLNKQLIQHGHFTAESVLLNKTHEPVPVLMHMKLIKQAEQTLLLTEFHNIQSFKDIENSLNQAQDRARNIMTLISREKQQITDNIQGNLGLVALPLIDQLRTTATATQKEILKVLENRIKHITRKMGFTAESGLLGTNLTRRQILICAMIRDGMTSKEIATVMGTSPSTINNHRNAIRKKLGLTSKSANLQAYLNSIPGSTERSEVSYENSVLDGLV